MITDPISDMLIRLKNATRVDKEKVKIPYSKMKRDILEVLKGHWYISGYKIDEKWKFKELDVTFSAKKKINELKRISKPWCRRYSWWQDIKPVLRWYWISIITTSQWVMAWYQAYKQGLGWEILCEVH